MGQWEVNTNMTLIGECQRRIVSQMPGAFADLAHRCHRYHVANAPTYDPINRTITNPSTKYLTSITTASFDASKAITIVVFGTGPGGAAEKNMAGISDSVNDNHLLDAPTTALTGFIGADCGGISLIQRPRPTIADNPVTYLATMIIAMTAGATPNTTVDVPTHARVQTTGGSTNPTNNCAFTWFNYFAAGTDIGGAAICSIRGALVIGTARYHSSRSYFRWDWRVHRNGMAATLTNGHL